MASRKVRSRANLLQKEYKSAFLFRELKTKKSKFGFTTTMLTPEQIIGVGKALDLAKRYDTTMAETVIQYNRNTYEKNRMFIYTNQQALADALRALPKVTPAPWKMSLQEIT